MPDFVKLVGAYHSGAVTDEKKRPINLPPSLYLDLLLDLRGGANLSAAMSSRHYVAPTSARAKRPFKSLLKPWLAHGSARRIKPSLIFSLSVGPCGGCWARNSGGGAPTVRFYLSSQQ